MAITDTKSSSPAAIADLLPDPTTAPVRKGDADDLIASIAEQQIDALISDAHADEETVQTGGAAELAQQASQELAQMAQELSDQVSADLVADLTHAASEAVATQAANLEPEAAVAEPPESSITPTGPGAPIDVPADALTAAEPAGEATEATAPPVTIEAVDVPANALADQPPVEREVVPSPMAMPAPHDAEINQAEIDALIAPGAPHAADPDVERHAFPGKHEQSSAAAVARELAEEAAAVAAHLPALPAVHPSGRLRETISGGFFTVLEWINYPARNLPDSVREVIGIIAIVTLVNAMSLLLYLMIFG